ncbi:TNF receptor-associated factor family protein DDB_G0272829 [Tribolium castaneum]|uniref:TNF receptor-associated factor family protein DDB_G0272829 n=1 Tax=Tribolium castaneum TaxID=7070 RepID=UPI00046C04C4|nr:PREDICTED: TNF receptor-associated factor family protein DDB_G0272829 [Tribolium castaneum]|eukprot:XP_008192461.1 PREDICTED: TNF receptor-associated factor family protein DDB_G0272829 [Tribolium castaneum]
MADTDTDTVPLTCEYCGVSAHKSCAKRAKRKCCEKKTSIEDNYTEDNGTFSSSDIDDNEDSLSKSLIEKSMVFENSVLKDMNADLRKQVAALEDKIGEIQGHVFTELKDIRTKLNRLENYRAKENQVQDKQASCKKTPSKGTIDRVTKTKEFPVVANKNNKATPVKEMEKKQIEIMEDIIGQKNYASALATLSTAKKQSPFKSKHTLIAQEKGERINSSDGGKNNNNNNKSQEDFLQPQTRRYRRQRTLGSAVIQSSSENAFLGKMEKKTQTKKIWLFVSRVHDHVTEE